MAVPQPGSALMSEDLVATERHVNIQNLEPHLKPSGGLRAMLPLGPCQSEQPALPTGTTVPLDPDYCQGPCMTPWPMTAEFCIDATALTATKAHWDVKGLGHHLGPG